jgi:hypothetical protein
MNRNHEDVMKDCDSAHLMKFPRSDVKLLVDRIKYLEDQQENHSCDDFYGDQG